MPLPDFLRRIIKIENCLSIFVQKGINGRYTVHDSLAYSFVAARSNQRTRNENYQPNGHPAGQKEKGRKMVGTSSKLKPSDSSQVDDECLSKCEESDRPSRQSQCVKKYSKSTSVEAIKYSYMTCMRIHPLQDLAFRDYDEIVRKKKPQNLKCKIEDNGSGKCGSFDDENGGRNPDSNSKANCQDTEEIVTTPFKKGDDKNIPGNDNLCNEMKEASLMWSMEPRLFALEQHNLPDSDVNSKRSKEQTSKSEPSKSDGKRRYMVAHLGRFMHHYWFELEKYPCHKHYYEMIRENTPCRLYFGT